MVGAYDRALPSTNYPKKGFGRGEYFFTLMVQGVTFKGEDYMCYGLHWYMMAWHWHYILQHILMPHMV
jgi:hypothetical protein